MMLAAGMLTAASCSEFSDYNAVPTDPVASGNQTLWENILAEPQLSDFATLVKRSGFDTLLSAPRNYTVFAPVNGTFDPTAYDTLTNSELLYQFVGSHVAEFMYNATGAFDTKVHTINQKSFPFKYGASGYTYAGNPITSSNVAGNNGVMHLMNGVAVFRPNIYEYLSMGKGIDSIRNHFKKYELTYLDEDQSVEGPMVNGMPTYIDSVMVTYNVYVNQMNARLSNEDSTYTMIIPNDKAFNDAYENIKKHYNYIPSMKVLNPSVFTSATGTTTKTVETKNVDELRDSLVRSRIIRNLVYSNTDKYNKWLIGNGANNDTIRSTVRGKYSGDVAIANDYVVETVQMSNGFSRIVDSLAFKPWEWYNPMLEINPSNNIANHFNDIVHQINYSDPEHTVFGPKQESSSFRYAWIEPNGEYSKPDIFVNLPGVLSGAYNFYIVFMPYFVNPRAEFLKPNLLNFTLSYTASNGNETKYNFSSKYVDPATSKSSDRNPRTQNATTAFSNNPMVTDTLWIGQFEFPVCYRGVEGDPAPCLRIHSPISVFSAAQKAQYTRDVRIGKILMRPVEYDEKEPLIKK